MRDGELLKVKKLICESLKRKRESYEALKTEQFSEKEAEWLRKTFVGLIDLVYKKKTYVSYEELAIHANKLFPNYPLPTRGGTLAQNLGRVLGELSLISWCVEEFLISVAVVNKAFKTQGKGFEKLVIILGADLNEKNRWFEKVKEIAEFLEGG